MRYAIISDIHGNLTALDAVLEDCTSQDIDKYLYVRSYFVIRKKEFNLIAKCEHKKKLY